MTTAPAPGRVAVLRNNFLPYSETFIHDELRHHERYEATVLARRVLHPERFPGHRVVSVVPPGIERPVADLMYGLTSHAPAFDRELRRARYDLLHAHFGHNGAYALDFADRHDLPLVVSCHGHDVSVLLSRERYWPGWWFYMTRVQRLFERATLFLAASNDLRNLLLEAGCPEDKIVVHHLGVDLAELAPLRATKRIPGKVTMCGRFVEKKGHLDGIAAVAAARDAGLDVSLTLIGDGPLRGAYERVIEGAGLSGRVHFTGALSHTGVLGEISTSEVFLAPSVVAKNLDRDSGLIVAKEAAGLGVPVIGTKHGGIPDIVEHDVTGFLVAERDREGLGGFLATLLDDPTRREAQGRAAVAKMQREYDIVESVRRLEDHYDRARALYRETGVPSPSEVATPPPEKVTPAASRTEDHP